MELLILRQNLVHLHIYEFGSLLSKDYLCELCTHFKQIYILPIAQDDDDDLVIGVASNDTMKAVNPPFVTDQQVIIFLADAPTIAIAVADSASIRRQGKRSEHHISQAFRD